MKSELRRGDRLFRNFARCGFIGEVLIGLVRFAGHANPLS